MAKDFSGITSPVMIYQGEYYTVIEAANLEAAVAMGWSATPTTDIYTTPKEFGEMLSFDAPAAKEKKGK